MQYSGHNTPLGHHTDRGPMGLGQYDGLGDHGGPHTASSGFLMIIPPEREHRVSHLKAFSNLNTFF